MSNERRTGPMYAGKTTRLLQYVRGEGPRFGRVVVAKWSADFRSGSASRVATHDGDSLNDANTVHSFETLDDVDLQSGAFSGLGSGSGSGAGSPATLVAVDEAQFFGQDLLRLWERLRARGRGDELVVAGLDLDFKRERFGHVLDLVDVASESVGLASVHVARLEAHCHVCGSPAPYTMRTVASKEQVLVGGADMYQPTCCAHHEVPEAALVAAQVALS